MVKRLFYDCVLKVGSVAKKFTWCKFTDCLSLVTLHCTVITTVQIYGTNIDLTECSKALETGRGKTRVAAFAQCACVKI
jgi:hypothetical protein